MNTDQTTSMVRSVLKVAGGILLAHGASKAAAVVNGEDSVGLVVTIVGFVWSHFSNSDNSIAKKADAIADKAPPVGSVTGMVLILGMLSLAAVGCSKTTLAPGGAYANMPNGTNAFNADLPIVTAYNEMDAFVVSEANNHAWYASNFPVAVTAANYIRANGSNWCDTAVAARKAFVANSSSSNQTVLDNALAVISVAVSQATNYIKLKPPQ